MEIKILGKGCPKCQRLETLAREVVEELGLDATFTKVKDVHEITAYGVALTPALVIDEELKCAGRIPSRDEIAIWVREAAK